MGYVVKLKVISIFKPWRYSLDLLNIHQIAPVASKKTVALKPFLPYLQCVPTLVLIVPYNNCYLSLIRSQVVDV